MVRTATLLVALVCGVAVARADDPKDAAEAKRHFEAGTSAFNLGEFARAAEEYRKAYKLRPDPVFLYNIAQAYRLAKDPNQALFFYRSFLRNMPNAPNRKEVEDRIKKL